MISSRDYEICSNVLGPLSIEDAVIDWLQLSRLWCSSSTSINSISGTTSSLHISKTIHNCPATSCGEEVEAVVALLTHTCLS